MANLREQIVSYLKNNQTSSAINLANQFNVTIANIRYHLKFLLNNGFVEVINDVNLSPRGRPTQIYSLSRSEKSTGLNLLLRSSLEEISQIKNKRLLENRLRKLAIIIIGSIEPIHPSLTIRLGTSITRLNELGYKARWEAHSSSPNIILHNCPYSSLIDSFPILCQLDHFLLNELLGKSVEQTEKLTSFKDRHPICQFSVK